jgi:aspartokinase
LSPVQRGGITVRILDVHDPAARGTILEARTRGEGPVGIAARRSVLRLDLAIGASELRAPRVAEFFTVLARHRVEPGFISTAGDRVSVLVAPTGNVDAAVVELGRRVSVVRDLALAAVIGRDIGYDATLAARSLEMLTHQRVEVAEAFVGVRAPSQVFVVPAEQLERAVRVLHTGLLSPVRARV